MYIYYRENGEVVSYSEEKFKYGNLLCKKINQTQEIQDKINKGYKMKYNGSLSFEEPQNIKDDDKKKEIEDILTEVSNIKDIEDIKKILIKLIK